MNIFRGWMKKRRAKQAAQVAAEIFRKYDITDKERDAIEVLVRDWRGAGLAAALCVRFDLTVQRRRDS